MVLLSAGLYALVLVAFVGLSPQPGSDLRPYVRLGLSGVLLSSVMVHSLSAAMAPSTDVLRGVLARLPVSNAAVTSALMQPLVVVGVFIAACLAAPSITMIVNVLPSLGLSVAAVGLGGGMLIAVGLGVIGGIRLLCWLMTSMLGLPRMYGNAVSALITLGVGVVLAVPGLSLMPPTGAAGYAPGVLIAEFLIDPLALGVSQWVLLAAWPAVALGLFILSLRLPERGNGQPATRLLAGVVLPRRPLVAYIVSSVMVIVRLPQYIVISLLAVLGAATVAVAAHSGLPGLQLYASVLAVTLIAVPWSIGTYVAGSMRWLYVTTRLTPIEPRWSMIATYAATWIAGLPVAVMVAVIGAVSGQVGLPQVVDAMVAGLALAVTTTFLGSVVPFAPQQPLSATVTSVAALGGYAVATLVIGWTLSELAVESTAVTSLGVAAVAAAGALLWGRRRVDGALGR
jgi:hypothetical protein